MNLENPSLFGPTMQHWVIAVQDHRLLIKMHVSTFRTGYKQDGGWDEDLGIKETGSKISKGYS